MSKDYIANESPDVASEAAAWLAQLESGRLTPADREAFREWLGRSPRHVNTIRRLTRVSMELNGLTDLVYPLEAASSEYPGAARIKYRRWQLIRSAAALAATLLVAIVVVFYMARDEYRNEPPRVVTTPVGGYEEVALSDGSILKVNTDSQLEVHYTRDSRKIRLIYGEAYFEVASNPDRPFLVYAKNQYVRAVGTAFLVRMVNDQEISVSVVEGEVEVAQAASLGTINPQPAVERKTMYPADTPTAIDHPARLGASQRITVSVNSEVSKVDHVPQLELQRELSWQQGLLEFSDTTLEDVVKELSRYEDIEVHFLDPSLKTIRFGGLFRSSDFRPLFDALHNSYGVDVSHIDSRTIHLSRAKGQLQEAPAIVH